MKACSIEAKEDSNISSNKVIYGINGQIINEVKKLSHR